jgi:hypothetical protein
LSSDSVIGGDLTQPRELEIVVQTGAAALIGGHSRTNLGMHLKLFLGEGRLQATGDKIQNAPESDRSGAIFLPKNFGEGIHSAFR